MLRRVSERGLARLRAEQGVTLAQEPDRVVAEVSPTEPTEPYFDDGKI